jgi:twitching motility protein PilT
MSGDVLTAYSRLIQQPHGIVLVTGPTGSGKTTTLYASLGRVDTATTNVLTVEDPVEYELPGIGQTQVNPKIDLTFAKALRAILRQDPDVIMIGEMRDTETIDIALKAAETGHLVLSAIHTPDAVSTIQRFLGLFEADAQAITRDRLGDALAAIVSLRLLTTADARRRVPAVEILRMTRTVREHVRGGRLSELPEVIRKGRDLYSMQAFDQHLMELVSGGVISMETALYAASNPEELERSLRVE